MITHCPHCRTEYLLEDTEMPSGGLSLECAECKQVFGVIATPAPAAVPPPAPARAAVPPARLTVPARSTPSRPPQTFRPQPPANLGDDEVTPLPGPAPTAPSQTPRWQLKRESGEVVLVESLDTLKQWISQNRARRDDLLTQDGVAWQRLANVRELIPSFELASRPDATLLVARRAFVAKVARDIEPEGPDPMEAVDTWPGHPSPLPIEPPLRHASTEYEHGKDRPFARPLTHLHRDYPAMWRRQQWLRWGIGGMVGLTVGLGVAVWVAPPWLRRVTGALYHESVPEGAITLVHQGYVQLNPDTVAALQQAIGTFKRATAVAGHYAEAHAGLAEAQLSLAETYRLQAQIGMRPADKKRVHKASEPVSPLEKDAASWLQAGFESAQIALRLGPESTAANRAMALYYEIAGDDPTHAAPFLQQARAAAPDDARVMYVDSSAGGVPARQAIEGYLSVVERMPQFNRARYKLARLYVQENDMPHARQQVEAILTTAPNHSLARALVSEPQGKGGISAVVSNMPGVGDALRGVAGDKAGLPELPSNPSYETLVHQGQLLRATHQLSAAAAMYERAIALAKRRSAGYIGLAWCELEQEQSGPAVVNFTYAAQLSPWSVEAHYGLAEALRASGDRQQAIKQYRQVLAIEPDGALGRLARQVLDEISR